jgi:phosphonate transport system substrate-binding protein
VPRSASQSLRFVTWLAPSLPLELFEAIAAVVGGALGVATTLASITEQSGPDMDSDPLTAGEADVGFVCAPTYLALRRSGAPVELLGVSPVFEDPRAAGRPVYFSDVVVSSSSTARELEDLRGKVFAYNDTRSLSGWHCLAARLPGGQDALSFFRTARHSGSHLRSLDLVAAGEADVAAIDSNVLRIVNRRSPGTAPRIRVLQTWGPWPIQPIVVRSALDATVKAGIRQALLAGCCSPASRRALRRFGLVRFASVGERDREWRLVDGSHMGSGPSFAANGSAPPPRSPGAVGSG